MNRLERIGQLPQPSFESGEKNITNVLERRLVQGRSVEPINRLTSSCLSTEINNLKLAVETGAIGAEEFFRPAWHLLRKNTIYLPDQLFVRASPFHCDNWLRDTFIGTLFLDEPELEKHLLTKFEKTNPCQLPTTRLFPGSRLWHFDDESTMLGLLWRFKLVQNGIPLSREEIESWTKRWGWVGRHVQEGYYFTPAGTEHSWFDTFKFPKPDVIAYNQGIYAVAAIAAQRMSLDNQPQITSEAIRAYRNLAEKKGSLPLSRSFPYSDASSIFGEFLSIYLFGQEILPSETVRKTAESLPKKLKGTPVVLKENGNFLLPSEFNRDYLPGDYHNGADWPAWSAIAQVTAELNGVRHDRVFWQELFARLQTSRHPEYFNTNPNTQAAHNPRMENHLWNTVVYCAAEMVLEESEMEIIAQKKGLTKTPGLYSEAAQIS